MDAFGQPEQHPIAMKRILLAGLLLAPFTAGAVDTASTATKPQLNLKQVRVLYNDIVSPIEATPLWFKKPLAARVNAELDADKLIQRIERTFGESPDDPSAPCRDAAIQQRMYLAAMNNMVALSEGRGQPAALDLLSALRTATAYGKATADCRRYLETLVPEGQTLEMPAKRGR